MLISRVCIAASCARLMKTRPCVRLASPSSTEFHRRAQERCCVLTGLRLLHSLRTSALLFFFLCWCFFSYTEELRRWRPVDQFANLECPQHDLKIPSFSEDPHCRANQQDPRKGNWGCSQLSHRGNIRGLRLPCLFFVRNARVTPKKIRNSVPVLIQQ